MCRLCGITASKIVHPDVDPIVKMDLMHELMLRSVGDEGGQHDGWGVTDGVGVWKSAERYATSAPLWKTRVNTDNFLLSHIRRASVGTGMTVQESHPYVFNIGGHELIGVHNGFIDGAPWGIPWSREQPNTDSWKAYSQLADLLRQDQPEELTADLFNEWLHPYTTASHYAFMMLWRGSLYALRGSTRTLHFAEIGDGFIIHTTQPAVDFARRYLDELYGVTASVTWKMNDNTCIRFKLGETDYTAFDIKPNHVAKYVTPVYSHQPKTEAAKPSENQSGTGDTANGTEVIVAPSVTRPRIKASSPAAPTDDATKTLREKRDLWKSIAGSLSPMRANLLRYWLSQVFDIADGNGHATKNLLLYCSYKDLQIVEAVLTPIDPEGNKLVPFVQTTRMMLNHWNHIVNPEFDVEAHELLFGSQFFWLDRRWTHIGVQEIDPYLAAPAWITMLHKIIIATVETKPEAARFFDMEKVSISDTVIVQ